MIYLNNPLIFNSYSYSLGTDVNTMLLRKKLFNSSGKLKCTGDTFASHIKICFMQYSFNEYLNEGVVNGQSSSKYLLGIYFVVNLINPEYSSMNLPRGACISVGRLSNAGFVKK